LGISLSELANGKLQEQNQKSETASSARTTVSKTGRNVEDAKIDGELMSSLGNSIKISNQLLKACTN
jgi:hypothetical protein